MRGGGTGETSAHGCPRTRKCNSIFTAISVIYILGDYQYCISLSSLQKDVMKRWKRDLREFAAAKRQFCDLAKRIDCPLSAR